MRITQEALDSMLTGTIDAAKLVGLDASAWKVVRINEFYRIVIITPNDGHRTVVSFIGLTKREAYQYLSAMREGFWLAHQAKSL